MSKIYLVKTGIYDHVELHGIVASQEDAEKFVSILKECKERGARYEEAELGIPEKFLGKKLWNVELTIYGELVNVFCVLVPAPISADDVQEDLFKVNYYDGTLKIVVDYDIVAVTIEEAIKGAKQQLAAYLSMYEPPTIENLLIENRFCSVKEYVKKYLPNY